MPYVGANRAHGRLSAAVAAEDVSIPIAPTDPLASFPTLGPGDWTYAVIFAADGNPGAPENVRINAISGGVLSVVRGVGGTVARAWLANDRIEVRTTAEVFVDVRSPPAPRFLSQAEYDALDPPNPEQLYGIQEPEERATPPDTLLTGRRIVETYRTLEEGNRLGPQDLDGFDAGVLAAFSNGPFTTLGPLIATCAVPQGGPYADGNAVAAAVWTVDPMARAGWRAAGASLAWDVFAQGESTRQRMAQDGDDGWWLLAKSGADEMDRWHVPEGAYGPGTRRLDVALMTDAAEGTIVVRIHKVAPAAGPPVRPEAGGPGRDRGRSQHRRGRDLGAEAPPARGRDGSVSRCRPTAGTGGWSAGFAAPSGRGCRSSFFAAD